MEHGPNDGGMMMYNEPWDVISTSRNDILDNEPRHMPSTTTYNILYGQIFDG
jgi:hypothetical protein